MPLLSKLMWPLPLLTVLSRLRVPALAHSSTLPLPAALTVLVATMSPARLTSTTFVLLALLTLL